jgi:hypothetical protein
MADGPGRGIPDTVRPEHRPGAESHNEPLHSTDKTPGGTNHGAPKTQSVAPDRGPDVDLSADIDAAKEWPRGEHVSEPAMRKADERLSSLGSVNLGEQQLDAANERAASVPAKPPPPTSKSSAVPPNANPQPGGPPSPVAGIDPRRGPSDREEGNAATPPKTAYPAGKATSKDALARQLGFSSFLEFFEGSQPLVSGKEGEWYVTALPAHTWAFWSSQTLEYSQPFPTLEEAKQANVRRR